MVGMVKNGKKPKVLVAACSGGQDLRNTFFTINGCSWISRNGT